MLVVPSEGAPTSGADGYVAMLEQRVQDLAAANAQLSQRYERRLAVERRLRHVATGMHRVLDVDAILSFGVAELVAAFGDRAVVYRLGVDGSVAILAQWFDDAVPPVRELEGVTLPTQLHRQAWRLAERNVIACVGDVQRGPGLDPDTRTFLADLGVTAMMSGAIQLVDDEVLLIVVHGLIGPRLWREDDTALFEGIVYEIATALRNTVALEQQQAAFEALQLLDRDKDAFVSNVSHELRTPLASVLGYLELLRDEHAERLTDEQVDLLGVVERNAGRLLRLTEDLLLFARVQDADRTLPCEPVDLEEVVRSILTTVRPTALERNLELAARLPAEPIVVRGSGMELERALLNLVGNAVKFTPSGGQVTVDVSLSDDRVRLQVRDDGVGIPEEEHGRLFERFYRGSAAQRGAVTGSGLGLPITRHIVERHGGGIELWSQPGVGTTVTVELPR
ncbi:MAG: ATP-binding protein [Nitriliruptoraceae bacterium]